MWIIQCEGFALSSLAPSHRQRLTLHACNEKSYTTQASIQIFLFFLLTYITILYGHFGLLLFIFLATFCYGFSFILAIICVVDLCCPHTQTNFAFVSLQNVKISFSSCDSIIVIAYATNDRIWSPKQYVKLSYSPKQNRTIDDIIYGLCICYVYFIVFHLLLSLHSFFVRCSHSSQ